MCIYHINLKQKFLKKLKRFEKSSINKNLEQMRLNLKIFR